MWLCRVARLAQEYMFLFFKQLNLKFVIYDVVSSFFLAMKTLVNLSQRPKCYRFPGK